VPFDLIEGDADITIGIDVVGVPTVNGRKHPTSLDLVFGASQLMMQSIVASKLNHSRPDIFLQAPVSRFRALDFLKIDAVMAETVSLKEELKRAVDAALRRVEGHRPA
jgi:NTE family protein